MRLCASKFVGQDARGWQHCRRVQAVPDESVVAPASDTRVASPESYSKTTFSTSPSIRSHPLDQEPAIPGKQACGLSRNSPVSVQCTRNMSAKGTFMARGTRPHVDLLWWRGAVPTFWLVNVTLSGGLAWVALQLVPRSRSPCSDQV